MHNLTEGLALPPATGGVGAGGFHQKTCFQRLLKALF
jgi:hypothetical protein